MLTSVVEWLAVVTAMPILAFLAVVLVSAVLHSYGPGLGVRLRGIVRVDLEELLEHQANLRENELNAVLRSLARLRESDKSAAAGLFADAEATDRFFERLSISLYGEGSTATNALTRLQRERANQWQLAEERVRARLARSGSPLALARRERAWIGSEVVLVLVSAFRNEGMRVARIMIARAGADVTSGSVVGLVVGVACWAILPQSDKIFLFYIGNGVTLGAFGGLALTAAYFANIFLDAVQLPSRTSRYVLFATVFSAPLVLHVSRAIGENLYHA